MPYLKAYSTSEKRFADLAVGADAAVHVSKPGKFNISESPLIMPKMSEEIENPSVSVPKSILTSILINGCLGFGILMATLFGIGNLDNVLKSPTNFPFMEIFLQATRSVAGTTALASLVVALAICATIGLIATSSRMTWSFARDRGLPFSRTLSKVGSKTTVYLLVEACILTACRYLGGAS